MKRCCFIYCFLLLLATASAGDILMPRGKAVSRRAAVDENPCTGGMLLFREDFGGNEPEDPRVRQEPVTTMNKSYRQLLTDRFGQMGSGRYIVTKSGYCNGDTAASNTSSARASQWYIQDDHTYPDDYTRGYFLEVDGRADGNVFYETTISDLCPGTRLSFSAYIANVELASYYISRPWLYAFPRLKFVLRNPDDNSVLAEYSTGDIPYDPILQSNADWIHSSTWHLVGLTFAVPDDVGAVKMSIYNDVSQGGAGNDFAIDDIEIRLCLPPLTIDGPEEVCRGQAFSLTADFTNDGTLPEPVEYRWEHSTDGETWETCGNTQTLPFSSATSDIAGWYRVLAAGSGSIDRPNCRMQSDLFSLSVNTCSEVPGAAEGLCMTGTLLFRDDFGGNNPDDPLVRQTPVPGMTYGQLLENRYPHMGSGHYLVTKEGYKNGGGNYSQWHIQDDHTYPGDYTRGYFMEVDGDASKIPFYTTTISDLCPNSALTFSAYVVNVMNAGQYVYFINNHRGYTHPALRFELSDPNTGEILASQNTDTIGHDWSLYGVPQAWAQSAAWQLVGINFVVPKGIEAITLKIYNNPKTNNIGNDFAMDDIEIHLCMPPAEITSPPVVCLDSAYQFAVSFRNDGTLAEPLEYRWLYSADQQTWTERWNTKSPAIAEVKDEDAGWYKVCIAGNGNIDRPNCRTFSSEFRLDVEKCTPPPPPPCPKTKFIEADTTVCDTLMPLVWRGVLFTGDSVWRDTVRNTQGCETLIQRLSLATVHCEPPCPASYSYTAVTVCREDMPYTWRGQSINRAGWLRDTLVNAMGCDSIITLTVNMKNCPPPPPCTTTYGDTAAYVCPDDLPYKWRGQTLQKAGQATATLTNAAGCDSLLTLTLALKDCTTPPQPCTTTYGDTTAYVCPDDMPYKWRGQTLQKAGQATATLTNAAGCDSLLTLTLALKDCTTPPPPPTPCTTAVFSDTAALLCRYLLPYTWHGRQLRDAGRLRDTLVSAAGCDSIVTLTLSVEECLPPCATFSDTTATVCEYDMPYTYRGRTFTSAGDYRFRYTNTAGCDSIRTLHLLTDPCENLCAQAVAECTADTVCADDDRLPLTITVRRGRTLACEVLFSDSARRQGFSDMPRTPLDLSPAGKNRETLMLPVPQHEQRSRYVRPDDYSLTLLVEDTCGEWTEHRVRFTVIYPAWVVVQKWNDALAVYNERYNGGYRFSDIQWYREGQVLQAGDTTGEAKRWETLREDGLGEHHSYIYTLPALRFGEAYWAELTREDDGKTFRTCPIYPEPKNADIAPDNDGKTSSRILLTQRTGSDGRPEWTVWSELQCTWTVYDVLGRVCALGQCNAGTGNNVISLLYPYAPGTYIVIFNLSDGTEETRKLLIR